MMEFTEVVSPSVAVPVLCVLVCAFLVFAFGFKSPAQPPSFDVFDDDGKKKRSKKSKGSKGQTNGHAVVSGEGDINNSAKPQPSPRQTVKQAAKSQSSSVAKSKSTPQVNQDLPKKTKKQSAKEEEVKSAKVQEEIEDDFGAGWHMVPKKDKKQKKKDAESKQEKRDISPVKEEEIVPKSDDGVAAAAGAPVETPGSPQEQRSKKKKDRKNKKAKQDEEMMELTKPEPEVIPEKPAVSEPKEKEPTPEVANIELQIKEAMETTVEETVTADKKKKNKKDRKKVSEEDDFVIPSAAVVQEAVSIGAESADNTPLKENTEALTVKVTKKNKKKDRNKKSEEHIVTSPDSGASASAGISLSKPSVSDSQPKKTSQEDTSVQGKSPVDQSSSGQDAAAASESSAPTSSVPVFDELGVTTDSWTEAKPKSKKKKARRAD